MQKKITKVLTVCFFLVFVYIIKAQSIATPYLVRMENASKRHTLLEQSLTKNIPLENIGPNVFGGRVVDIEANPSNPIEFYVAFASGGLWYTKNNGNSFTPIFDHEAVITIGDIAIDWEHSIIYIGTGENNSSRSSYSGTGIYKSKDNGNTWNYLGLGESQHIGRILIDQNQPNKLIVAALGHLFTNNKERGIYISEDGGLTWKQSLYINDSTGVIDLIQDPKQPNIMYASTWTRIRKAWNLTESGYGSAIFKTEDGGLSWRKISTDNSGFPTGEGVGRIGLAICSNEHENYIYALLDNQDRRQKQETKEDNSLTKEDFKSMSKEKFLQLDSNKLNDFLEKYDFPKKYSISYLQQKINANELLVSHLAEYVEDANSLLFDTPIKGAELYKSTDQGVHWTKTHEAYIDGIYYTYGYYFGQVRVNPKNGNEIYLLGVPILKSVDGGKNFKNINGENQHGDHHALWINPNQPQHIINGNDGGINISYDGGDHWLRCTHPPVAQFYSIQLDKTLPYHIYAGAQDNGVWQCTRQADNSDGWQLTGKYPHEMVLGGDGMQIAVDNRKDPVIFTGFQFGNYFKIDSKTKEDVYITPKHELGDRPYRWNWQSPLILSKHSEDIIYFGANKLLRSLNQGKSFQAISPDLTNGGQKGDVPFGTISCIDESQLQFGLLYTGSDDGKVYCSVDGGVNWIDRSKGLPDRLYVSSIKASVWNKNRLYVCLNGHRDDHFDAYVYVSEDQGANWTKLGLNLPDEPLNVIVESEKREGLIFLGSDYGLYYSLDSGKLFYSFSKNLPTVAVHDIKIQNAASELVVGTHGRSLFIADISLLESLTPGNLQKNVYIAKPISIPHQKSWGNKNNIYSPIDTPDVKISLYTKNKGQSQVRILYKNIILQEQLVQFDSGINYQKLNLSIQKNQDIFSKEMKKSDAHFILSKATDGNYYLPKAKYTLQIWQNNQKEEIEMEIK